jgi:hypothetical protein
MKIFPKRAMPTDVETIFNVTQTQLNELMSSKPQELVAVKSRMGGYEMQLREVPRGQEFVLVKSLSNV